MGKMAPTSRYSMATCCINGCPATDLTLKRKVLYRGGGEKTACHSCYARYLKVYRRGSGLPDGITHDQFLEARKRQLERRAKAKGKAVAKAKGLSKAKAETKKGEEVATAPKAHLKSIAKRTRRANGRPGKAEAKNRGKARKDTEKAAELAALERHRAAVPAYSYTIRAGISKYVCKPPSIEQAPSPSLTAPLQRQCSLEAVHLWADEVRQRTADYIAGPWRNDFLFAEAEGDLDLVLPSLSEMLNDPAALASGPSHLELAGSTESPPSEMSDVSSVLAMPFFRD